MLYDTQRLDGESFRAIGQLARCVPARTKRSSIWTNGRTASRAAGNGSRNVLALDRMT